MNLLNFMKAEDWLKKNFSENVEEAAAYLRLSLEEAQEDPEGLLMAVKQVVEARGGIEDLGLSLEEKAALATALSHSLVVVSLPQAA